MSEHNPLKDGDHRTSRHYRTQREDPNSILGQIGVNEGSVVADLGCGEGYFTILLTKYVGEAGYIYAVDMDREALSFLRGELSALGLVTRRVEIIEADVSRTPIPSNSVDFVIIANLPHDIKKYQDS